MVHAWATSAGRGVEAEAVTSMQEGLFPTIHASGQARRHDGSVSVRAVAFLDEGGSGSGDGAGSLSARAQLQTDPASISISTRRHPQQALEQMLRPHTISQPYWTADSATPSMPQIWQSAAQVHEAISPQQARTPEVKASTAAQRRAQRPPQLSPQRARTPGVGWHSEDTAVR